jgi:UDP-N-acetylmuramyl pentapeptide synthase
MAIFNALSTPLRKAARQARKVAFRLIGKRGHAAYRRWRSPTTFIGVTGSSGKTATASLLSHILSGVSTVRTQIGRNFW